MRYNPSSKVVADDKDVTHDLIQSKPRGMTLHRYPILTESEWLECGRKAKEVKKRLNELLLMKMPRRIRDPHLLCASRNVDQYCCLAEEEMLRQHATMENATHVFYER